MEIKEKRRVFAVIDLDAIDKNIISMKEKLPEDVSILAVIKTNAYGHGAEAIAKYLEKNDAVAGYAVATAEEALELRKHGIKKLILTLGYVFEKDYMALIENEIRFCVFRKDIALLLDEIAGSAGKKAYVHIKVDTGMHRIGFLPTVESRKEIGEICNLKNIICEGIFTHFARADEADKSNVLAAYHDFSNFVSKLEEDGMHFSIKHCCNSASILEIPDCHMNLVRAGITLYGLWPSDEMDKSFPLYPVMSLYSYVVHIKDLPKGCPISYGGTFVTKRDSRIATIPIGYGDGYPRSLSNKGYVLIRGKKVPIVGRVCMDQLMVDVTDVPDISLLDQVTIIGCDHNESITMEEIGDLSGRFNYELACDLGNRIPRYFVKNDKIVDTLDFFDEISGMFA